MEKLWISVFMFYATVAAAQSTSNDFTKLTWLEGTWSRTNAKAASSGVEVWTKNSNDEWSGKGIALRGADTVFVEKLKIILKDGTLYYVADVPQNKTEVLFKFTSLTEQGFVCENAAHDFPKKITYTRDGEKLVATISGDGKSIDYKFEKMK